MNKSIEQRIGLLRQWLNEDRITDPEKMVTNDQIKHWLDLDSTIKQAAEEIRGMEKGRRGYWTAEEACFNQGLKAAAKHLESLI